MPNRSRSMVVSVFLLAVLAFVIMQRNGIEDDMAALASKEAFVTLNDARVHYRAVGPEDGEVVVLEAGLGGTASDWAWVLRELEPEFRVIAYDRLGSGLSTGAEERHDSEAVAHHLAQIFAALGINQPATVIGYSLGGLYARSFQALYPQLVKGLLLVDPTHPDQMTRLPAEELAEMEDFTKQIRKAAYFANFGFAGLVRGLESLGEGLPSNERGETKLYFKAARHLFAVRQEIEALPLSLQQVGKLPKTTHVPLGVLSSTLPDSPGVEVFQTLHQEIAASSRQGFHQLISGARHETIIFDRKFSWEIKEALQRLLQADTP